MAEIGRSFDILDKKIKQVGADIRAADGEVRKLDKSLKLNPGNVDTVRQKYNALSSSLQLNTQKLNLLKQKQGALTAEFKAGNISQKDYERELVKIQKAIAQAEGKVNDLTAAMRKQNAEIREAKFNNLINGLDKAEKATGKLSKASLALVGTLAAVVTSAVKVGDELDDNAKKYGTTAEALQIQTNRFAKLTANSETYTAALVKIGSMQSSIAAGRGARYLSYLEQLGIAQEDLEHKTNAEIYDLIYEALRNVNDETDRAIIAQGLLGDEGLNVATVAGTSAEAIAELDNALIANGIITSEQAAKAGEVADMWDSLKYQYQAAAVEVLVALMPAIQALSEFLQNTVIPLITTVAGWLGNLGSGGQKILLVILMLIIVLPKIIALVKMGVTVFKTLKAATLAQTAATATLNTVSTPWLGIIMAISAALMLLISLIQMFVGEAKTATDTSNELLASMGDTESKLNEMGYSLDYSAEQTYYGNTKREVDVNVKVDAQGDGTEINDGNAERIAGYIYDQISIDLINQLLGSGVR